MPMTDLQQSQDMQPPADKTVADGGHRVISHRLGRFAAITPPAVTLLLSVLSKPAAVATSGAPGSSRQLKEPVSVSQLRGQPAPEDKSISPSRRATLRRLGRFAAITPPVVTLLLSARSRPALA